MSKVIKLVAVIAIAVAIVVFAPAIGAALASVAGSLGVTVAGSAIASALVGFGLTMAMTATLSAFRKSPNLSSALADRLNRSVVPTAPRKIVFGTTAAGNDERFFEVWGTKKDRFSHVIALASHRVHAIRQFYVENDLTWNGTLIAHQKGITQFRAVSEGKPGTGFAFGSGSYWKASSSFTGCAYIAIQYDLDPKEWPSGIPAALRTIVDGCPVYDPRRDSTNGGNGPQRINDQSTWAFYDGATALGRNPALCLATYLLGWRINGQLAWGKGVPETAIDWDNIRLYANVCEERVAVAAGGTVQRYTCDGIFSTADTHETVISGITAAMGSCKLADPAGTYALVGGYDDTSGPVIHFTLDDLIAVAGSTQPYVWTPSVPARESFNIMRGRFADPANLYQLNDWGEVAIDPLADGVPRVNTLELGCVSRSETCQRIAKQILLRNALGPGTFTAGFGPKAFACRLGSLVSMTIPSMGWNRKFFRVVEQAETHDMFYQMTLLEESAAIYAWDKEEKPLPPNIRPTGWDPSDTLTPTGFSVSSETYRGIA